MKCLFVVICVLANSLLVFGQEDPVIQETENTFVKQLRRKEPRPKFLILDYTFLRDVYVTGKSRDNEVATADLISNERFGMKLRFPIVMKSKLTLLGGINIKKEFFDFDIPVEDQSGYYSELDRRFLNILGFSVIMKKPRTDKKFTYAFLNGSLNSNDISLTEIIDQLKITLAYVIVIDKSPITQIGYGGAFGYIFGGPAFYPVFIYNHTFTDRLGLEMMLPKSAKLRYTFSPEMHLLFTTEVNGASYYVRDVSIAGFTDVTFQRSAIGINLTFEREIYDWLWFGITGGYNIPINLYLSEPRKRRKDALVLFEAQSSPIVNFSIFAVVPKKIFYKKAKDR